MVTKTQHTRLITTAAPHALLTHELEIESCLKASVTKLTPPLRAAGGGSRAAAPCIPFKAGQAGRLAGRPSESPGVSSAAVRPTRI
ncbi:hypothetical protein E2C01_072295 [Portunus trituberculatus]|uniref:Uncharacterized protein n=1 Tax=Portunus trituberculatus TaxID=210409 RepID=A0A5B7IAC9_PORTR|nr:hypothetical protein [Portunus trituberculatus]